MATISDVAKLSGVSVSTVSRVINNNPHVSKNKIKKVKFAMKQLGYEPLLAAQQLRGSSTKTIEVVLPSIINPFFSHLVNYIQQTAIQYSYKVLIFQTLGKKEDELNALELLKHHQVDGIILCALENDWDVIKPYKKYGQIAVCNEYVSDETLPCVAGNQYEAFLKGTNYIISKGKKKIAYCTGASELTLGSLGKDFDSDRYLGFTTALKKNNLEFNPNWMFTNAHSINDGKKIAKKIVNMKEKPEAIIAGSDEVATGIMSEAIKRNIKIPEELGIMGVDDQPFDEFLSIPLTTIKQPIKSMGEKVTKILMQNIKDKKEDRRKILLNLDLVIRKTI